MKLIPDDSSQMPRFDSYLCNSPLSSTLYHFDIRDRSRAGKIIPCNPLTGHRIKDGSVPAAMWVHSRLKALHQLPDDWVLSQCLFGEHLLPLCPDLTVALVEAEKTAVICSAVFPEFLWLATGGLGQFNDRVKSSSAARSSHIRVWTAMTYGTSESPLWHGRLRSAKEDCY